MTYFRRKLWFADTDGKHHLDQDDLLVRREPIVVLGEPGMGKTKLLETLGANEGNAYCRAQQLINRARPETLLGNSHRLVIDALDEVSAQSDGDAVDLVLRKLGELDYPSFILSCRVGEWRAATSARAIADQYDGISPLEVHLEPLDEEEQGQLLTDLTKDPQRARALLDHFDRFGQEFLGNPQTLAMIAALPIDQPLPATSGALFEQAVETLRQESNPTKSELPRDAALDAAGAAFAALIMSGHSRIVDKPSGMIASDERALPLVEVEALDSGNVRRVSNTKLFATDRDGWSYIHRRVGEFVGARWLAARANTRTKRTRLLEQFRSHGLVPASLRGLHAWLARDPQLADAVIDADPMGVIEYGDAEALTPQQARRLFAALERLASDNPIFAAWQEYRAMALVNRPLMGEVARVISDPGAEFVLRLFLLQQLKGRTTASDLRDLLRERLLDEGEPYGIRYASAQVLITLADEDWPTLLEQLRCQSRDDDLRLAYELLDDIGLETFSDQQIVDIVLARDGLSMCSLTADPERSTAFGFYRLAKHVPVPRLDGLLDLLAENIAALLPEHAGIEENELIDLQFALILKRLESGSPIQPLQLWRWLEPFDGQASYHRDQGKKVGEWLKANPPVRLAIQRHILIDRIDTKNIWERAWPLHRDVINLYPTQAEIISLLEALDPQDRSDERWREVLELGRAWGEEGRPLREAAKRFAEHRPDLIEWIDGLAERKVPEWERKQEEKQRQVKAKRAVRFAEHRRDFLAKINGVKAGEYGLILPPAQAYLKRFHDIGDGLPAHERVVEWLGEEVAAAARDGFEAFLQTRPPRPSAKAIALSYAEGRRWPAGDIIVAALAERLRTLEKPFFGVPSERLAAGLYECWHSALGDSDGIKQLGPALEIELKRRGKWGRAVRLFIEPQLRRRVQHVDHLWALMRDDDSARAADFAECWLTRFPDMSGEAEAEMIDRLIRSSRRDALRTLLADRQSRKLSEERRRNWDAVGLIFDFEATRQRLGNAIEPALLWHIRARVGGQRYHKDSDGSPAHLSVQQIAWIISTFRSVWPVVDRPGSVTVGDTNPWDASEYIRALINRLGNDVSVEAVALLAALRDAPDDGFTWALRTAAAEQRQKQADEGYDPPALNEIKTILDGGPPGSGADLRAIVADELRELDRRLRGSSEDEVNLFWTDNGSPRTENECRDLVVALLRGFLAPLSIYPADEVDMPQGKRADIVFQHNGLFLPVEAKRQQHKELWKAINGQLEAFYTGHWQAEKQGLFLVFWFGSGYRLPNQPDGGLKPTTAAELQDALEQHAAVKAGRVEVIVLDLSR